MANTFNHNDKVVITDGGNVGIGTTNPDRGLTISRSNQYASLNIYKANTTNQIVYLGTGSSGTDDDTILQLFDEATEKVRIFTAGSSWFNGGNVGIGTTSPTSLLHLSSNNSTYEANGVLSVSGGVNAVFNSTERFIFNIDSDNTQTDRTFDIAANTTGSSGGTLLFRVQENGNVGIGTTSPAGVLDVQKNNTGDQLVRFWNTNTAGTGSSVVRIANSGNNNNGSRIEFTDQQYYVATISADRSQGIIFRTSATGTDPVAIAERMRITSAGNVGIGTTAPQAPLHVIAASNNNNALIQEWSYTSTQLDIYSLMLKQTVTSGVVRYNFSMVNNGTAYNDVLVLDRGNVGIGTTSPGVKLDVFASANSQFRISATDASPTTIMMDTTTGSTDRVRLKNDAGAFKIAVQNSSDVLTITSAGSVGIGTTNPGSSYSEKLQISNSDVGRINITHTNVGSSRQSDILFTENSTLQGQIGTILGNVTYEDQFWIRGIANIPLTFLTNSAERMRITSAGNVGIGTTSPVFSNGSGLVVHNDSVSRIKLSNNTGQGATDGFELIIAASDAYVWNYEAGAMLFGTSSTERMRITSAGNVGIGTTAPGVKLTTQGASGSPATSGTTQTNGAFRIQDGTTAVVDFGVAGGNAAWLQSTNSGSLGTTYSFAINPNGGNVGIGTTSPSTRLEVLGDTEVITIRTSYPSNLSQRGGLLWKDGANTTGAIDTRYDGTTVDMYFGSLYNSGYNSTTRMVIKGNGNVGIGTTGPTASLQVGSGTSNTSNRSGVAIFSARNDNAVLDALSLVNTATGNNNNGTALNFHNGNAWSPTGRVIVQQNPTGTTTSSNMQFQIYNAGLKEVMRITSDQNVGIGTTSPVGKLNINTGASGVGVDVVNQANGTISFANGSGGTAVPNIVGKSTTNVGLIIRAVTPDTPAAGVDMQFIVNETDDTDYATLTSTAFRFVRHTTSLFNVLRNGNVGIGTTSPTSLLHLSSNNSTYEANGVLSVSGGVNAVFNSTERFIFNIDSDNTQTDRTFDIAANTTGSSGGTLLFRVQENGNVGIGTNSPSKRLHVASGNNEGIFMQGTANGGHWFDFKSANSNLWSMGAQPGHMGWYNRTDSTYKMVITDGGNVGIGTTAPNTKLRIQESGTNPPLAIQNTNADGYSGAWIYNSAGTLVGHFGWANGTTTTLSDKMYFGTIAAKDVVFTTNDSEKVRITSAGNVGIGTTTPSTVLNIYRNNTLLLPQLRVENDGTGDAAMSFVATGVAGWAVGLDNSDGDKFKISRSTGDVGTNTAFTIDGSGNVGIGTTVPGAKLEVFGTGNTLRLDSAENGSKEILFRNVGTGTATIKTDGDLKLYVEDAGKNILFDTTGGEKMRITSAGNVGIGTTSPVSSANSIFTTTNGTNASGYITQVNGTTSMYVYSIAGESRISEQRNLPLVFETNGTEKVRFTSGGNVGIGTTSPANKLEVSVLGYGFRHYGDASNYLRTYVGSSYQILDNGTNQFGYFNGKFYVQTGGTDKLTIDTSGNVGIGTTSPAYKLEVSGGAISIKGNAAGNSLRFDDSGGTSRNAMYLDTSNYLNVGNSSYAGIKLYHTATAPQANGLEGNQIAEGYGITENGKVLAEPNAWLAVRIGTTDYAIPMYTAG